MANKDKQNVKRFIQDVSVKVADDAYNGGGGGTYTAGIGIDITDDVISNNLAYALTEINSTDTSISKSQLRHIVDSELFPIYGSIDLHIDETDKWTALSLESYEDTEDGTVLIWTSNVIDNKYYKLTFTVSSLDTSVPCTIEEISVGGGSLSDKYQDVTALLDAVGTVVGHDFTETYPVLDVEALRNLLVKYNFDLSSKMEVEQLPGSGLTPNKLKFAVSGTSTQFVAGSGFWSSDFYYHMELFAETDSSTTKFKAENSDNAYTANEQFSSELASETATWNDVLTQAISDNINLSLGYEDSDTGVHTVLGDNEDPGVWDRNYEHSATFGNICLYLETGDGSDTPIFDTFITYIKPEDFITIFKFISF